MMPNDKMLGKKHVLAKSHVKNTALNVVHSNTDNFNDRRIYFKVKIFSIVFILSIGLFAGNYFCQQPVIIVSNFKVEELKEMNGLEQPHPRLSWQIFSTKRNVIQTGYQIMVATTFKKLNENAGNVWSEEVGWSEYIIYPL